MPVPQKSRILFLLFTAVLPLVFSAVLLIGRVFIRELMGGRLLVEGHLTVLVHRDEVRWHKPGKEAILQGRLFDVSSLTVEGSHIRLRGLFDDDETWMQEALAHNGGKGRGSGSTLLQRILLPCLGLVSELDTHAHEMTFSIAVLVEAFPGYAVCRTSAGHPYAVFQPPPFYRRYS